MTSLGTKTKLKLCASPCLAVFAWTAQECVEKEACSIACNRGSGSGAEAGGEVEETRGAPSSESVL
eukprot:3103217-Amphidinium_carterae.1